MEIEVHEKLVRDKRDEYCVDYAELFAEYTDGYICDRISQIADDNVDIYNSDLWDWARSNEEYIEEAVMNFGIDERNFDLIRLFQQGQMLYHEQRMYDHLDCIIKYYAYDYIENELETEEMDEDSIEELDKLLDDLDSNNTIEDIIEKVMDVIGGEEDDSNN